MDLFKIIKFVLIVCGWATPLLRFLGFSSISYFLGIFTFSALLYEYNLPQRLLTKFDFENKQEKIRILRLSHFVLSILILFTADNFFQNFLTILSIRPSGFLLLHLAAQFLLYGGLLFLTVSILESIPKKMRIPDEFSLPWDVFKFLVLFIGIGGSFFLEYFLVPFFALIASISNILIPSRIIEEEERYQKSFLSLFLNYKSSEQCLWLSTLPYSFGVVLMLNIRFLESEISSKIIDSQVMINLSFNYGQILILLILSLIIYLIIFGLSKKWKKWWKCLIIFLLFLLMVAISELIPSFIPINAFFLESPQWMQIDGFEPTYLFRFVYIVLFVFEISSMVSAHYMFPLLFLDSHSVVKFNLLDRYKRYIILSGLVYAAGIIIFVRWSWEKDLFVTILFGVILLNISLYTRISPYLKYIQSLQKEIPTLDVQIYPSKLETICYPLLGSSLCLIFYGLSDILLYPFEFKWIFCYFIIPTFVGIITEDLRLSYHQRKPSIKSGIQTGLLMSIIISFVWLFRVFYRGPVIQVKFWSFDMLIMMSFSLVLGSVIPGFINFMIEKIRKKLYASD